MPEQTHVTRLVDRVLTPRQEALKRALDLALAVPVLVFTSPLLVVGVLAATISTREWGIFSQTRIGRDGRPIRLHKVRSMRTSTSLTTTETRSGDPRITRVGRLLRRFKIDELPQLVDVLRGDMSMVGPRPDVAGWADRLHGQDLVILSVRPGITGPASLAFRHEEEMLSRAADPAAYNREVIWPEKVRLNREYVTTWSLRGDLTWILRTVLSVFASDAGAPVGEG